MTAHESCEFFRNLHFTSTLSWFSAHWHDARFRRNRHSRSDWIRKFGNIVVSPMERWAACCEDFWWNENALTRGFWEGTESLLSH
jgi:hypothetical protein